VDEIAKPHDPTVASSKKMDRSLAGSIAWRAAADWTSQILTWGSFLIVARLLSPKDYGIVSMAVILFAYLRLVGEFGLPETIVALRDLTENQLAQLNSIAVALAVTCFGISCILAFPLASFFRIPKLAPVVIVTCLALVALGVRTVPEALLEKDMRFRWISLVNAGCDVFAAAVTLVMAWRGFAYWALVAGNLAAIVARSILMVRERPHSFALPRLDSIRRELRFGWHVFVSVFSSAAYSRLDNATAGRVLGPAALGFYSMAWNLANVPLEKLTTLVTSVIHPYFAVAQKDLAALRRYVRTLTELIALATFPATIGLGLVARELVPFALGKKWEPAVPALEVLSAYAALRSVVALLPKVLTAVGDTRFVMWDELAALVMLPCGFYIGSHWGIAGIAWSWVAVYPCAAVPLYWKVFKTIQLDVGGYFRALRPALEGTAVMVIGVVWLKRALPAGQPLLLRLGLEIGAGATIYVATVLLLHRERTLTFWKLVKEFRQSKN
jgi:O-antigen/teichoic acid export membrane protein